MFNPVKLFRDPKDAVIAAAVLGEIVCLGTVITQKRRMKKNNEEAQWAIDSAAEVTGLMTSALEGAIEVFGLEDATPEEKVLMMLEKFTFVQMIVQSRLEEFKGEEKSK